MAKLTGKWYDQLNWTAFNRSDEAVIFGHHFPKVKTMHTYRNADGCTVEVRWRNKDDEVIHTFELEPDWKYDDPTTQIQALLVAIKLS